MDADVILFLALLAFAISIAGGTAFVIFWPLTLVHIRDRHPQIKAQLGPGAFLRPAALLAAARWLSRHPRQQSVCAGHPGADFGPRHPGRAGAGGRALGHRQGAGISHAGD